jgi:hypothetical protein
MPLSTSHLPKTENDTLRARAEALHLHGLLTHWSEVATQPWLAPMLDWEEQQRALAASSGGSVPRISAASNHSATSTGPGQNIATAPPSMR